MLLRDLSDVDLVVVAWEIARAAAIRMTAVPKSSFPCAFAPAENKLLNAAQTVVLGCAGIYRIWHFFFRGLSQKSADVVIFANVLEAEIEELRKRRRGEDVVRSASSVSNLLVFLLSR